MSDLGVFCEHKTSLSLPIRFERHKITSMRKSNQTSFKPGHKRSPESIEKQRATLLAQYESGEKTSPLLGSTWTDEQREKHRTTKRAKSLGNRTTTVRGNRIYVLVMTEQGHRYEHRVVMEKVLGRPLLPTEHVHHIDHDGLNNDPSNLELLSPADHNRKELTGRASPTKGKKMFEGWSRKHECCIECSRTSSPHAAKGVCRSCYVKRYR
jgi:HNH endonuclease